jgi:Reverse transcriptase (RNA-dependent DNA polymerase)
MRYQQINVDHIEFDRQHESHTMMPVVYVNDIIITGDDEKEIAQLKMRLSKEFKVKDLCLF